MSADQYAAFISYSHADEKVARWLHRKLESYRTPRPLVGKSGRHGLIARRLGRVFRDREEFAAGGDLKSEIQAALARSTALIVLCSARSKASTYVNAEIEHFRSLGRGDRIIPVILDGEPSECFPGALNDGVERLGADFREDRDEREGGFMKILAGLLGVGVDELVRREQAAQRARVRLYAGAAAAFAGVAAAAVFFWFQSAYNERIAQRRAAILSIDSANVELAEGRTDAALLILLEAARTFANETPPDSLLIGFDAALRRAATESEYAVPANARFFDAPSGVYIADPATFDISLLTADSEPRPVGRAGGAPGFVAAGDGALVVVRDDFTIERIVAGEQPETIGRFEPAQLSMDRTIGERPIALDPSGTLLVLQPDIDRENSRAQIFDIAARRLVQAPFVTHNTVRAVRFDDGAPFVFDSGDNVARLDAPPLSSDDWWGNWPASAPAYGELLARACLPSDATAEMRAAFITDLNGRSLSAPGNTRCRAQQNRALLSHYQFSTGGGYRENTLLAPYDDVQDVGDWVREILSTSGNYLSGAPVGVFSGGDLFWVDLVGDQNVGLAINRDILVSGGGPALGDVFSRRYPSEIAYVRALDATRLAIVDADTPRISILNLSAAPYAATLPQETPALRRRSVCTPEEPFEGAAPDGAMLRFSVAPPPSEEEPDSTTFTLTSTLNGEHTERTFRTGPAANCAQLSPTMRYALIPRGGDDGYQLFDLSADAAAPVGEFDTPLYGDISFAGDGPSVLIAEGGNVVSRRDRNEDGSWRRTEIYRGNARVVSVEADADVRRLLMLEDLGSSEYGAFLYSLEARQVWRRFASAYKWIEVHFSQTGEIVQSASGEVQSVTHLHTLGEAVAAAREALPERCRGFSGENYPASPCWPEALRN